MIIFHPVGTVRMQADAAARLDPQVPLRGLVGLRVADASVMSAIPGGSATASVMMIAEKAAEGPLRA